MYTLFTSAFIVFLALTAWILIQHLSRLFASKNPQFGPAKEEGGSCFFCLCKNSENCPKKKLSSKSE